MRRFIFLPTRMKLRFILIGILVIVWGYFIYMNNQKDINARVAESEKLIATNSGLIKQARLTIVEKTAENQRLLAIVEAWKKRVEVTSAPVNKPSSGANTWWPQAPYEARTGVFTCTIDWENMLADKVDDVYNYEYLDTCGVFTDYDGCWIRREDWANCFKK